MEGITTAFGFVSGWCCGILFAVVGGVGFWYTVAYMQYMAELDDYIS